MTGRRSTPPLERTVVLKILKTLRSRGAFAEKVHGDVSQPALLDIVACYRGRFICLEVKRDAKSEATPRQKHIIRQVQDAGGVAYKVSSVEEVERILNTIDMEIDDGAAL